jgi:hypothetical protein
MHPDSRRSCWLCSLNLAAGCRYTRRHGRAAGEGAIISGLHGFGLTWINRRAEGCSILPAENPNLEATDG